MPSSSDPLSRRRILAGGGGILSLAVAGCAGDDGRGSRSESVSEHRAADGRRTIESTHEYDTLWVRSDDDEQFVYEAEAEAESATTDDDRRYRSRYSRLYVLDADDAAALHLETTDADADEIRTFVENTDFDAESVVVEQRPIGDCYRRTLVGVRAEDDDFRTEYCQTLKDATTPCEADREVVEAIVIRVHRPYDERPSSHGSGESHACGDPLLEAGETANPNSDAGANSSAGTEVDGE